MKDARLNPLMLMASNKEVLDQLDSATDIVPAWHRKGSSRVQINL